MTVKLPTKGREEVNVVINSQKQGMNCLYILNKKKKRRNTLLLTHSQQLTENVQNVQSGLDIPGVLSKPHTVHLLNNIQVYMVN